MASELDQPVRRQPRLRDAVDVVDRELESGTHRRAEPVGRGSQLRVEHAEASRHRAARVELPRVLVDRCIPARTDGVDDRRHRRRHGIGRGHQVSDACRHFARIAGELEREALTPH
jgi:hypothetical protein